MILHPDFTTDRGGRRLRLALSGLALTLVATGATSAQEALPRAAQDSISLSLPAALARIASAQPRLAVALAQRALAQADASDAAALQRNRLVPTASATFSAQRLVQNQFAAIARRAGVTAADAPADPISQVFAASNTRVASLTASIRPLDGGVSAARTAGARRGLAAADLGVAMTRASLELEVVSRYADLQMYHRLAATADMALDHATRALAVTRQAFAAGRTAELDVWRAESAVAAQRPAVIEARRAAQLAELQLRQLVDLPEAAPLRLESPLESWCDTVDVVADRDATVPARAEVSTSRPPRLALRQLGEREREAAHQQTAAMRQLLPTVELQVNYQQLAYPRLGSQLGGPYFGNTTVAALVSLPLDFTGQSVSRIQAASAARRLAVAQRHEAERAAALEAADLALSIDASRAAWRAAVAGTRAAERALAVAMTRYEVGRATLLELQDTRLAWQEAVAARARAARDRLVADARAERLERLPLGETAYR